MQIEQTENRCVVHKQRLHALKDLELTATVVLPGKDRQGWVLTERNAELNRRTPLLRSEHQDNEVVFAELNHISRPLPVNDLACAVARLTGERPTSSRLYAISAAFVPASNTGRLARSFP